MVELNRIGVADRQPFRIHSDEFADVRHILDRNDVMAFSVWAFRNPPGSNTKYDEEELEERTRNLLSYFNLTNDNPAGDFT